MTDFYIILLYALKEVPYNFFFPESLEGLYKLNF